MRVPLQFYPGMNRFVLDRVVPASTPASKGRPEAGTTRLRDALIESNHQWGLDVATPVNNWADGAVTLVAGQQVGFAGGPLYTLSKIASLVKMKRYIERSGQKATIFFWLATEDHDFDEVAQIAIPKSLVSKEVDLQLNLVYLRAPQTHRSHRAVGPLPVPEPLVEELLKCLDMERPTWLRPGITFRDSFAELIASIFGNEVVLVDSLLPELRRAGAPLFDRIREKWDDLQSALHARSKELAASGYVAPIEQRGTDRFTLLFEIDESGTRHIVDRPRSIPPERTSTSAVTRPLLQDFVFQPAVFVGGPAEVAYYAQIAPLHDLLGVQLPRVALRGHVLVAPKRLVRFMSRFDIKPETIFTSPDQLLAEREPEGVAEIRRQAAEGEKELMARIERIGELGLPAEHALARAVNRSIGHIEYHFRKLTERAIKGLVRKDKERYAAVKELIAMLYPDQQVQDRIAGWFPFWHRYREQLVERVIEEIEPDAPVFKIVEL